MEFMYLHIQTQSRKRNKDISWNVTFFLTKKKTRYLSPKIQKKEKEIQIQLSKKTTKQNRNTKWKYKSPKNNDNTKYAKMVWQALPIPDVASLGTLAKFQAPPHYCSNKLFIMLLSFLQRLRVFVSIQWFSEYSGISAFHEAKDNFQNVVIRMLPSQDLNLAAKKYWSSTLLHLSGFFFWRGRALSQAIAILAKKTCWASSQELKTHIYRTWTSNFGERNGWASFFSPPGSNPKERILPLSGLAGSLTIWSLQRNSGSLRSSSRKF